MSESIPDQAGLSIQADATRLDVVAEPPDQLILRDKTGGLWGLTVAPNGQLQTSRLPADALAALHRQQRQKIGDNLERLFKQLASD